ncbi:Phosphoglycerate kinase [Bertholletia excelsa]
MSQILNIPQGIHFGNNLNFYHQFSSSCILFQHKPCPCGRKYASFQKYRGNYFSLQGSWGMLDHAESLPLSQKEEVCDGEEFDVFPPVQTLRKFPREELFGKVTMVRFDSAILLHEELDQQSPPLSSALSTIKYLYNAGARVLLVSNWTVKSNSKLLEAESVAGHLSAVLQLTVAPAKLISLGKLSEMQDNEKSDIILLENFSQFREELASCLKFSEQLSKGVDVFVNDVFSLSHRVLASTVGVTRFCYACVAGFHFEEGLYQLKKAIKSSKKRHVAIIGGGKFLEKAPALRFLASRCDGLVFVGMMAFQIMHVQGLPVPMKLVEHGAYEEAMNITQFAKSRSMPIVCPKDFWCTNESLPNRLELLPAHGILDGWQPVDIGPKSLDEISSFLSECQKILWIGPVKFCLPSQAVGGAPELAITLDKLSRRNCEITVVGNMACESLRKVSASVELFNMIDNASVTWEILKGRKLPGLMALDKAYPFDIDWGAIYAKPTQPLVVDIGSGNGLFLFRIANIMKDLNFLGLEINKKLVNRCLATLQKSGIKNRYFIATNATSTFRSIVSSYPGKLVLVSIQCPNPDFNKPEHRWSMVQRLLVEAIVDLLVPDGKVFLQSDVEAVVVRMKEQFVQHGKGKFTPMQEDRFTGPGPGGWLKENPFGVQTDWEQHVIDRGAPMYRLILSKSSSSRRERYPECHVNKT